MSHQIHKLNVIYRARRSTLYYLARGNGQHVPGYVTSLREIRTTLNHIYGSAGLELHCVYDRRMHELRTNENLQRALRHSAGSSLSIHAYDNKPCKSIWNSPQVHQDIPLYVPSNASSVTNSQCYHCRRSSSKGTAYAYAFNSEYRLCSECYRKSKCWNKKCWKKHVAVAHSGILGVVPHAPLPRDMSSVRQLQNILVKLGYMRTSHTFGSFKHEVSRTEDGVVKFRRKYGIHGIDMREYDLRTERKLAQVVRKYRQKGNKFR